ncbi:MAG TPA: hypothetical protein VMT18_01060, partial [Planctomycetota bacterium]|nr:hypothetical protein [Planctomycetota bacterium]
MKSLLLPLLLSSLVSAAVGAGVAVTFAESGAPPTQARAAEPADAGLAREVARLAEAQSHIARELEELRLAPVESARAPAEDVGA